MRHRYRYIWKLGDSQYCPDVVLIRTYNVVLNRSLFIFLSIFCYYLKLRNYSVLPDDEVSLPLLTKPVKKLNSEAYFSAEIHQRCPVVQTSFLTVLRFKATSSGNGFLYGARLNYDMLSRIFKQLAVLYNLRKNVFVHENIKVAPAMYFVVHFVFQYK